MLFYLPFARVPGPALWVVGSLTASFGLGCSASPSPGAVSPAASPATDSSAAPAPSVSPNAAPPAVAPEPGVSLEQLITLIARPGQWPLDVDAAEQLLQALGPVRREQPVAEALSLLGGPSGVLNRFEVSYAADEQGGWMFEGASFFLGGSDLVRLHEAVKGLLTQHIGEAEWTEDDAGGLDSVGWDLGGVMKLLFAQSPNGGERLLSISIAEPEGESD